MNTNSYDDGHNTLLKHRLNFLLLYQIVSEPITLSND